MVDSKVSALSKSLTKASKLLIRSGVSKKFEVGSWLEKNNLLFEDLLARDRQESFFDYLNLGAKVADFSE